MTLLLDTHAFIWWDGEPGRLPAKVLALCQDPSNDLALSVASLWEMQIKAGMGKIKLRKPLPTLVEDQRQMNGLRLIDVRAQHVFALGSLPAIHKDPFDRIIVVQARVEGFRLVTHDAILAAYDADVVW